MTSPAPRRQTRPPGLPGIWVREFDNERWAFDFQWGRIADSVLFDHLGEQPQHHHIPGCVWEGPFPIPSLPS